MMIESERLIISSFSMSDADEAFSWFGDIDVMKWIPGGQDKSIHDTKNRIQKYIEHYQKYGFSKYLLRLKDSNQAIGDAGIMHLDGTPYIELGYRIKKEFWRSGFATECAIAILNHSFQIIGLNEIHAIIEPENSISIGLIEKLKFTYIKDEIFFDQNFKLYQADKKYYTKRAFA